MVIYRRCRIIPTWHSSALFNPSETKFPSLPARVEVLEPSDFDFEVKPPYLLNQINISNCFIKYQKDIAVKNNRDGLLVETNPHELLAINNVLLLKPGQHSEMLLNHFSEELLKDVEQDLVDRFQIKDVEFDTEKKAAIDSTLKVNSLQNFLVFTRSSNGHLYYHIVGIEKGQHDI